MCDAVSNSVRLWKNDNTVVQYDCDADVSRVFLHGNLLAEIGENFIKLYDADQESNTTKSRLNALLQEFGHDGERVFARKFEWFVRVWNDTYKEFQEVAFLNGMRLA